MARQRQVPIVIEIELNEEEMFYTFLLRESVLVCHIKMPSGIRSAKAFGPARVWGWNFSSHSHILSVIIMLRVGRRPFGDNFHIEVEAVAAATAV